MPMGAFERNFHKSVNRGNSRFVSGREFNFKIGDIEQFYLFDEFVSINAERDERAKNHIAARARETIKIESFHINLLFNEPVKSSPH
jgi:hypothetical protein